MGAWEHGGMGAWGHGAFERKVRRRSWQQRQHKKLTASSNDHSHCLYRQTREQTERRHASRYDHTDGHAADYPWGLYGAGRACSVTLELRRRVRGQDGGSRPSPSALSRAEACRRPEMDERTCSHRAEAVDSEMHERIGHRDLTGEQLAQADGGAGA